MWGVGVSKVKFLVFLWKLLGIDTLMLRNCGKPLINVESLCCWVRKLRLVAVYWVNLCHCAVLSGVKPLICFNHCAGGFVATFSSGFGNACLVNRR